MKATRATILLLGIAFTGCGEGQSALDRMMQNRCVHSNLDLPRTIEDGQECFSFSYSDCAGDDYGLWCGESQCPKGTPGCPCLPDGTCYEPDEWWEVSCNAQNTCEGGDTCPYGCRVGSICRGGALCSGDCIGTPCC
jgi:hypothetical protein